MQESLEEPVMVNHHERSMNQMSSEEQLGQTQVLHSLDERIDDSQSALVAYRPRSGQILLTKAGRIEAAV